MSESAIKLLLGPILIGVSLNTFLYGVCVTQFMKYYISKRRLEDSQATRYLVAWELLVDTFHSSASIYFIWLYMVDNFLNVAFLQAAPWPLTAVPLLTAMSACPIQLFLAYRVFLLSKSRYISAMLIFLTVANAGLATSTSSFAFRVATYVQSVLDLKGSLTGTKPIPSEHSGRLGIDINGLGSLAAGIDGAQAVGIEVGAVLFTSAVENFQSGLLDGAIVGGRG
ncbi:hypothetical protein FB451DRAFT_1493904 [Mycena latifolia]|nr:hypothetical protein FB451DRAFT_1493904 [Mycena latifolia]